MTVMAILEDLPEDLPVIAEDVRKMQQSLAEMGKGSFLGLLRNKEDRLLNRTFLAMFSTFAQQMDGAGVIGFYTTTIFSQYVSLSPLVSRILSGSIYMFQLACSLVCFYTVDRVGRRVLMMIGAAGMGTVFIILAGTVSHAQDSRVCSIIAAICVFLFAMFFAIGALGVNYLYGTEVAPLAYRVPIYALTTSTLWCFNFLVVKVSPVGFTNLGFKYFIVFTCTNLCLILPDMYPSSTFEESLLISLTVVYFFFPETRMHSLEDMDTIFRSVKGPLNVVKVAKHMQVSVHVTDIQSRKDDGEMTGDVVIPETSSSEDGKPVVHSVENV